MIRITQHCDKPTKIGFILIIKLSLTAVKCRSCDTSCRPLILESDLQLSLKHGSKKFKPESQLCTNLRFLLLAPEDFGFSTLERWLSLLPGTKVKSIYQKISKNKKKIKMSSIENIINL